MKNSPYNHTPVTSIVIPLTNNFWYNISIATLDDTHIPPPKTALLSTAVLSKKNAAFSRARRRPGTTC